MSSLRYLCLAGALSVTALAQTVDVGSGSPTGAIQGAFVEAWQRNGFYQLVALPPLANVRSFGGTGYLQEFQDAAKDTGVKLAIIYNSTINAAFQFHAAMYAYYNIVTVATAGFPTIDVTNCPALLSAANAGNSCEYQLFDKNYALFTYARLSILPSQNFATRAAYYTKWNTFGGVAGLGPANSAETAVTSHYGSAATLQTYDRGAIYNITSGALSGRLLAIKEPVYDLYVANGAHGGPLGYPVTEELILPNGMKEQQFENGAIEYDPATGIPILLPPVASVTLQPLSAHLNLGDTVQVTATVAAADGTPLTDRAVNWNTSNGSVIQIQSSGLTAMLKAVGAGVGTVTATSGGKTSLPFSVSVTSPCCQIGEGAPASIQNAFLSAVTRDKLRVQLPAASPAARVGSGYVQQLMSTDATPVLYLIAVPDGASAGSVVTGAILAAYLNLGGPGGALGYPVSDASAGGRQAFQQGTLAGIPVQLVTGGILTKWAALGYEAGIAGSPTGAVTGFLTFRATAGQMQVFRGALILAQTAGPLTGDTFAVTGLILAQYNSNGGPAGDLGAPVNDESTAANGNRHQDFEGGFVEYAPGATSATVTPKPRQPLVTATPSTVLSGSTVHLTVGGFASNAIVRVSMTGQPDFLVTLPTGAYAWDAFVPASAPSGVIVISATQTATSPAHPDAVASYTIRAPSSTAMSLAVVSGDGQTGAPGTPLTAPLTVVLKDNLGDPAPRQPVIFTASPGAAIVSASAITDANGRAAAVLRLPSSEGVVLATAQAAHQVVTFSARAAAFSLPNFPALSQAVTGTLGNGADTIRAKGSLLTAAASILRYHQSRNELNAPNGLADPVTLNAFLKSLCLSDSQGNQYCDGFVSLGARADQTVNLWRVGAFAANGIDVSVEQPDLNGIGSLVASGSPVLLALSLNGNMGSHFVVATGIAGDGGILIADPDPSFGRTRLNDYLSGLAILSGAVRLIPRTPAAFGFLVVTNAPAQVSSSAGACGTTLGFPDTAAVPGGSPASTPGTLYFLACEGSAGLYQLDFMQGPYTGLFIDLGPSNVHSTLGGPGATSAGIARPGGSWNVAPLQVIFSAGSVVNAASLTGELAPGELVSIFGAGLLRAGSATTVQINGENATVIAALPFQINAQIPPDLTPGPATLSVTSGNGNAQHNLILLQLAPAIFSVAAGQAAIANQDNQLNTPSNPASRGETIVIYATGFGSVSFSGGLNPASVPVSAVVGGIELKSAFAGLTPGSIGLYQANVTLPATLPPGLSLPLFLKQGDSASNTVSISIQ